MDFKAGAKSALVGSTGSGKTTILNSYINLRKGYIVNDPLGRRRIGGWGAGMDKRAVEATRQHYNRHAAPERAQGEALAGLEGAYQPGGAAGTPSASPGAGTTKPAPTRGSSAAARPRTSARCWAAATRR